MNIINRKKTLILIKSKRLRFKMNKRRVTKFKKGADFYYFGFKDKKPKTNYIYGK